MHYISILYFYSIFIFLYIYNSISICTFLHFVLRRLRKGKVKMVLDQEQYYCVSLCEELHCIQLSILLLEQNHSAEHRFELDQYIQSKLKCLMNEFMQAATKPKAYIPCYYKDCNKLHVELQLLCDRQPQHCPFEEKPIPKGYYHDLFAVKG